MHLFYSILLAFLLANLPIPSTADQSAQNCLCTIDFSSDTNCQTSALPEAFAITHTQDGGNLNECISFTGTSANLPSNYFCFKFDGSQDDADRAAISCSPAQLVMFYNEPNCGGTSFSQGISHMAGFGGLATWSRPSGDFRGFIQSMKFVTFS